MNNNVRIRTQTEIVTVKAKVVCNGLALHKYYYDNNWQWQRTKHYAVTHLASGKMIQSLPLSLHQVKKWMHTLCQLDFDFSQQGDVIEQSLSTNLCPIKAAWRTFKTQEGLA